MSAGRVATPDVRGLKGLSSVAIRDLADMTWEEVRDLDRARTIAILPVGAVEAHGPHLPLATDVVIARAMARAGAERIEARGLGAVLLPPLPYTAAPYAAGFEGTISVRGEIALANAHLDPAHLDALGEAERRAREEHLLPVIFPDVSKKPWALRLTEEFQGGACHAGRYESSIVLAERSDLVRDKIRKELPPNPSSISRAIRAGAKSFEEAEGKRAYFGWPADATVEEGRASVDALGAILADAVTSALAPGKGA